MRPILLSHLGLGDAIVCAGLAVELARIHGGLQVVCWEHNEQSVKSFFVNHPEISIIPISYRNFNFSMLENNVAGFRESEIIKCGHYSGQPPLENEGFDSWMYRTAGVSLKHRWISDPLPAAAEKVRSQYRSSPCMGGNIFIHDDQERGFVINEDKLPRQARRDRVTRIGTQSILAFRDYLKSWQVHVINSSFHHLAESLPSSEELYLHAYARPHGRIDRVTLRKPWKILE